MTTKKDLIDLYFIMEDAVDNFMEHFQEFEDNDGNDYEASEPEIPVLKIDAQINDLWGIKEDIKKALITDRGIK